MTVILLMLFSSVGLLAQENVVLKTGAVVAKADEKGTYTWDDAVKQCASKGKGWRLPSKNELNEMFVVKKKIGGFRNGWYWSATENGQFAANAWCQDFESGEQSYESEFYLDYNVRCVRKL